MKKQPRLFGRAINLKERDWWQKVSAGVAAYGNGYAHREHNVYKAERLCKQELDRQALSAKITTHDRRFFVSRWVRRWFTRIEKDRALLYFYNTTQDIKRLESYTEVNKAYQDDVKAVLHKVEQRTKRISRFSALRKPLINLRNIVRVVNKAAQESVPPPNNPQQGAVNAVPPVAQNSFTPLNSALPSMQANQISGPALNSVVDNAPPLAMPSSYNENPCEGQWIVPLGVQQQPPMISAASSLPRVPQPQGDDISILKEITALGENRPKGRKAANTDVLKKQFEIDMGLIKQAYEAISQNQAKYSLDWLGVQLNHIAKAVKKLLLYYHPDSYNAQAEMLDAAKNFTQEFLAYVGWQSEAIKQRVAGVTTAEGCPANVAAYFREVDELKAEHEALKKKVQAYLQKVDAVGLQLKNLSEGMERQCKQLDENDIKLENRQQRLEKQQQRLEKQQQRLEKQQQKRNKLNENLNNTSEQIGGLEQQMGEFKKQLLAYQQEQPGMSQSPVFH